VLEGFAARRLILDGRCASGYQGCGACSMRSERVRSTCYLGAGWSTVEQARRCSIGIGFLEQMLRTGVLQTPARRRERAVDSL